MRCIITTTIHPPTEAMRAFAAMEGWHLIVVGDLGTPHSKYDNYGGITYLSPLMQSEMDVELSAAIGWNCVQRRNFGFIRASEMGAAVVATVDDDNVPLTGWGVSADLIGVETDVRIFFILGRSAFDPVYAAARQGEHWHRGFPIQCIHSRGGWRLPPGWTHGKITPRVVADLWQGNADVDAVCRIVLGDDVEWMPAGPSRSSFYPFTCSLPAPFNSQNTFLDATLLKDYFMFPHVGRMDDIWAAYHLQATTGVRPVFNAPSVCHDRHLHDLISDLEEEILGYCHNVEICERINMNLDDAVYCSLPERARDAWRLYQRHF